MRSQPSGPTTRMSTPRLSSSSKMASRSSKCPPNSRKFEPELRQIRLDRIRVDRISGKDNDRNKVERVRVNSEDDKAKNDYRDVYGSHISPKA